MLRQVFILITLCIFFIACHEEKVIEGEVKNPITSDIENIKDSDIKFKISKDSSEVYNTVSVRIGDKEYELTTLENWETISPSEYSDYQIPEEASDALRESNKDIYKILYVYKQLEDRVVVREGVNSAQQDSIFYKALLALSSNDISPDPEIDYLDIIGTYGYTDSEKSQILILSNNKSNLLSAVIYNSEEPELPKKENLASILMEAKPTALKNFFINEMKRSFKSESYNGKYRKEDNQVIIIFDNLFDKDGKSVEFRKIL
jgi:hypothetical protein